MDRNLVDTLWFAGWLAALLVLFWLGTRLPLQSRPPRLRALAFAWGTVLVALGVTFLANLALSRHDAHFDLTRERGFTPSPEAEAVVRSLTHEVRLTYFYQAQDEAGRRARHLVEMLGRHSALLHVRTVDPDKQPKLAETYGIRIYNATILEADGRRVQGMGTDENDIALGIQRLLRQRVTTVCCMEGHGEYPIDNFGFHPHVELEVVEGVLAVPFHEADGRDTLAQEPLDAERDVVLVGAHDLDPPAVGLQDRGVVDADPVGLGELRLLVGIDGADVQQRGVAAEHLDQVPGAAPGLVLRLIEVREPDLVREGSDDRFGLWRRGEAALPGQVEVRVVAGQREVRQKRDAERHQHRTPGEGERPEARRAALERQPGPEPEEDQQRGQPRGEPQRVDKIAIHRDLPPGERPHAQKEARESDAQEEAHVRQEERAGGERREVAEQREAHEEGVVRIGEEVAERVDHPEQKEEAERDDRGDDLVRGEGRDEQPHRDQRAGVQQKPEVAAVDRSPVRVAVEPEDHRVARREPEDHDDDRHAGGELREHDLDLANGRREEQLERARLALLGDEPHGDDGQHEHEEHGHLEEDVQKRRDFVEEEDARERVAHDEQEDRDDRVGDRRGEERPLLLEEQGAEVAHRDAAGPRPVSSRNTVSRSADTSSSSRSANPFPTTAAASASLAAGVATSTTYAAGSGP